MVHEHVRFLPQEPGDMEGAYEHLIFFVPLE